MTVYSMKPDDAPAAVLEKHPAAKVLAVKFTAAWCGPCRQHPFEKVAELPLGLPVVFATCDVDVCGRLAEQYLVRAIPMVLVFDRTGKVVGPPVVGVVKPDRFAELLRERVKMISSAA